MSMQYNDIITTTTTTFKNQQQKPIEKPIEKPKRKQVKNACVNCQKACKKCDDGRPCNRCIKLGLTATCRDSDRKERKKGVKRGPYKKRQVYNKDQPVYPKLTTEELMVPSQIQFPDLISYTQPISPANSFTSSSSDETLHFAYGYTDNYYPTMEENCWETTQLEKLLSMPIEQHYELNLLEGPSYWYPVHSSSSSIQQPSFIDYNIPLQFNQWS